MQEFREFDLTNSIEAFENESYVEEIIKVMEQNKKELGIFLSYYFKEEGGLVEEVKLSDKISFLTSTTGTFKVNFKVVYFNACWDIHSDNKEEMLIHFDFYPAQKKMRLTGPRWPEREPDEI
ncbi:MAG: hypothetical protein WD426_16190 [Anditalea sp.]